MPKPYGEWRYKPGDFYRLDDRTGFKVRSSRQRHEWQGLIVAGDVWEQRHPQDWVKGFWDDQTVPEPRPRPASDIFIGVVPIGPPTPPVSNALVAEDDITVLTAEDGVTILVHE